MASLYNPEKKTIGEVLAMTNPPILVPDWQRSFSWTLHEIQSFWEDLLQFEGRYPAENINDQEYFLGSIVIVDNTTNHLLLDGQQRLATSAILLSVIRDFLGRYSQDAATRLSARYLTDFDDAQNRTTFKLTLNTYDRDFFRQEVLERRDAAYVEPAVALASHELIRSARRYFFAEFQRRFETAASPEEAHRWALRIQRVLLSHMSIVAVVSRDEDNAAAVFETLNDRGIGLSTPDLLRNFLLRRAVPDDRPEIIDRWGDILELGGDPQLRAFLRHYWLSHEGDVKTQSLYREIKGTILERDTSSLVFTRSLHSASVTYRDIVNASDDDEELARHLVDINTVGATALYPALLSAYDVGSVEQRRLLAQALLVAFVRHNVIGGLESTQLEQVVYSIARDLRANQDFPAAIHQLIQFAPGDNAFRNAFASASLPRRATARYILRELELNLRATEELDVAPPSRVHVEHIYPQNPQPGGKWANHSAAINRIGNLTLLSRRLNAAGQNADFNTKRGFYDESELLLTRQLLPLAAWDFGTLEQRQVQLSNLALGIWEFPDPNAAA